MGIRKGLNTLLHLEQSFSSSKDCLKQRHCRGKIAQTDKQNDRRLDKLSIFKLKLFNKILIAFFFLQIQMYNVYATLSVYKH